MKETQFTDNIICPYCFYEDLDSWEWGEDFGEIECGNFQQKGLLKFIIP